MKIFALFNIIMKVHIKIMINEIRKKGEVNLKYLQTFLSRALLLCIKMWICISYVLTKALSKVKFS